MPDIYSHEVFSAVRFLIVAGFAWYAYRTARDAAANMGRWPATWRGALWCTGLAFFAALTLGQPSCDEQGDPLRGGCESYADDGSTPTTEQRSAKFLFFAVLLLVPTGLGISQAPVRNRKNTDAAAV